MEADESGLSVGFNRQHFDDLFNTNRDFEAASAYCLAVLERTVQPSKELVKCGFAATLGMKSDARVADIWHQQKAFTDEDWTPLDDGDVQRDMAIYHIGNGHPNWAYQYVVRAEGLHRRDPNRMACLLMVHGMMEYRHGEFDKAVDFLRRAQRDWAKLGSAADAQWVNNGRFHLALALVASGRRIPRHIAQPFMETERNTKKKIAMLLLVTTGRMGRWLIERQR